MKVFISSVITGLETFREAAAQGAQALRHQVIRAEDFGAAADSPQRVCLGAVRDADVVILLLGERYGDIQAGSGLSATHQEFREARDRCPVLVFVQKGAKPEAAQEKLIQEVQDWASGHYTGRFSSTDELRDGVVSALHDLEMLRKTGEVNETELVDRARSLVPSDRSSVSSALGIVVVGAPEQQVIRPAEIEKPAFAEAIIQEALFGTNRVFDTKSGSTPRIRGSQLVIEQENASILVDQLGSVRVVLPALDRDNDGAAYLPVLIQEEIVERLHGGLLFASSLLDRIDPGGRLTHVVPVGALIGAGYMGWKTRSERRKQPNTAQIGMHGNEDVIAILSPAVRPRAALRVDAAKLAEDSMVLLRRHVRS